MRGRKTTTYADLIFANRKPFRTFVLRNRAPPGWKPVEITRVWDKKQFVKLPLQFERLVRYASLLWFPARRSNFKGFFIGAMACILHITDHADRSSGLFPESWEIQCPFEHPDYPSGDAYDDITPDQYEEFKVKMIEIYRRK